MILFCADPLAPRRVDPHFAREAAAAGRWALLDHDALCRGDVDAAVRRAPDEPLWYRGWMIPVRRYEQLADVVDLVVPPEDYRRAHELPGWYPTFEPLTPRSVWRDTKPGELPDDLAGLVAPLGDGPGIVRDYVKSRKHEWEQACFVPDLRDTAALRSVTRRFVELQEDFLAGGIVVRAFERLFGDGRRAIEARVWWLDGEPIILGPHPDTPEDCPLPDLTEVEPRVRALGCRFVTTDLALRDDGQWRVVEVGDGQVSDLPRSVDPAWLVPRLASVR